METDWADYWFNTNHAYVMIWNCDEKKYNEEGYIISYLHIHKLF